MVAVVLLAGSAGVRTAAQSTIDALVKKCESLEDVSINRVVRQERNEKKTVVNISIPIETNQALVDEFIAAFRKEEESDSDTEKMSSITTKDGKVTNFFFRVEGKHYAFNQDDVPDDVERRATITIMTDSKVKEKPQKPREGSRNEKADSE